ncbi:hypothetical protein BGLA2_1580009 [Burkholderia gladioli]|nr:hypothetical protein BGLA2_1580009 [Burkholderia gladioli]
MGRGDDLPLSKLAAHGKPILTECDADGGARDVLYRPLTFQRLPLAKSVDDYDTRLPWKMPADLR